MVTLDCMSRPVEQLLCHLVPQAILLMACLRKRACAPQLRQSCSEQLIQRQLLEVVAVLHACGSCSCPLNLLLTKINVILRSFFSVRADQAERLNIDVMLYGRKWQCDLAASGSWHLIDSEPLRLKRPRATCSAGYCNARVEVILALTYRPLACKAHR